MAMDPLNDTRQFNDHRRLLGPLAILERTGHGHQRQECKKQHTGLPDKHPLSPTQQTKKKRQCDVVGSFLCQSNQYGATRDRLRLLPALTCQLER